MLGGEIKVVMTLDDGDFVMKTTKNGQVVSEMRKNLENTGAAAKGFEKSMASLGNSFHDTIFTLSLLRFALKDINDIFLGLPKAVMATSGEFEKMQQLLSGMSKETEKAKREAEGLAGVKFVMNLSKNAPFEIKALTDSFVKFKSAGLDPTNGSMQSLVDSVAKFGGNSDVLHRASIAIQQMAGKGVVSMEELRQQLGEAVPNAINLMAQGSGVSMAKLANEIKKGTVSATAALNNMFTAMSVENYKAAEDMMSTWTGMTARLSTEWELFKQDIGKAGFFDEVKKQVGDVLGLFDGQGAKQLAYDIGQGLKDIVITIRSVVDWFVEWKDEIKLVGELFLAYFAADKFRKIADAMKNSGVANSFKSAGERLIDEAQADAKILREKADFNRELIADNEKAIQTILADARAGNQKEIELMDQKIAAARTKAEAVIAAQQQELNAARDLNAQRMAIEAQAKGTDLRTETGRYQRDALLAEAEAKRIAVAEANNHAAILAKETTVIAEETLALERNRAALAQRNITHTEGTRILQDVNNNLQQVVETHERQAEAVAKVTFGTKLMHGAIEAGKTIWNAFGGWVGIAITTLTILGEKLYEYLNRWKEFDEIIKQSKDGMFSAEKISKTADEISRVNAEISSLEQKIAKGSKTEFVTDTEGVVISKVDNVAKLEEAKARRQQLMDAQVRMTEAQEKDRHDRELKVIGKAYEKRLDEENAQTKRFIADQEIQKTKALEEARVKNGDKPLNATQAEAIEKPYQQEIALRLKASKEFTLTLAKQKLDEMKAKAAALKPDSQEYKDAQGAIDYFSQKYLDSAQKAVENAKTVGSLVTQAAAPKTGIKHEHPLTKMLADMDANLEIAKAKLQATIDGVKGSELFKVEETLKLLGEIQAGKLDTTTQDANGKNVVNKFGGEDRANLIQKFVKYLKDGGKDIDAFIDKLGIFDAKIGKIKGSDGLKRLINGAGEQGQAKAENDALEASQKRLTSAQEDLNAATESYNSGGLAKQIPALKTLLKVLEQEKQKYGEAATASKEYMDATNKTKAAIITSDAKSWASEQTAELKKAEQAQSNLFDTAEQAQAKRHQTTLDQIEEVYKLKKATAIAEIKDADERARVIGMYDKARADAIKAANILNSNASVTESQKLAVGWKNTVDAMNKATASWSSTFMDELVNVTQGAELDWNKMATKMLNDLMSIIIKNQFADAVTGMFSSIGKSVSSALGGVMGAAGGAAVDPAKAEEVAAVTTAMTEMSVAVTSGTETQVLAVTTSTEAMTLALTTAVETMGIETTAAMAEMVTVVTSAMTEMAASAAMGGGGGGGAGPVEAIASMFAAKGKAFDGASMFAKGGTFTNKLFNQPTPFMFGNGGKFGVMGEAGPEAVMPLSRDGSGRLGVTMNGGMQQAPVVINLIEAPGRGGQTEQRQDNGVNIIDVMVEKIGSKIAGQISQGSGPVTNALQTTYGLNRVAGAY